MAALNATLIDGDSTDDILRGTPANDLLNGLAGDDLLIGGEGDDDIDGGLGIDRMVGNAGDDTYFVDNAADEVIEAADEGLDLIVSSVNYALSDNVEALGLIGNENLTGIGNDQDNFLLGNQGDNALLGLGGDDTFWVSEGDDLLNGGTGQDEAFYDDLETAIAFSPTTSTLDKGELGTDQLVSIETVRGNSEFANRIVMPEIGNVSLRVDLAQEQLELLNLETQVERDYEVVNFRDVTGGSQADFIAGNAAANLLSGGGGDDTLLGNGGGDLLQGGLGRDLLSGGRGNDVLLGFGGGTSEIDLLSGGQGGDLFLLGDERSAFYRGNDSYAVIADFDPSADFIVLAADPTEQPQDPAYSIQLNDFNQGSAEQLDTAILLGDDIIAILPDTTDVSFRRDILFANPNGTLSLSSGPAVSFGLQSPSEIGDKKQISSGQSDLGQPCQCSQCCSSRARGQTDAEQSEIGQPNASPTPVNLSAEAISFFDRFGDFRPDRGGDDDSDGSNDGAAPGPETNPAPTDDNNSLSAATEIVLTEPISGQVDRGDLNDFYRFSTAESGVFTAELSGLTGDADVRLIRDENQNGEIDFGEVIAWQWERGSQDESIRQFVDPGDYIVQVFSYNDSNAEYQLGTNFSASETDPLAFSIDLNFGLGLSGLSEIAQSAIEEAVDFWETAITHSSFEEQQNFEVTIAAGNFGGAGTLAFVPALFPTRLLSTGGGSELEASDRLLPANGEIVLNQFYFDDYNQDPNYLGDIVRHEMGHVLGIGTLWDYNDGLINRRDSSYSADSYAGEVYGELLGSFEATAVPIEPQINGHWDEAAFDQELLTPFAEGIGSEMPLSNLTLASLRDLGWNVNFGAAEPFMLMETGLA